jgi:5-methyltetrahydrofolate corrinoid/iron sulfur protein methyltransferase
MIVVAENINVMSKKLGKAMKLRDAKPIQQTAVALTEAGADYLDLNIGPAKKDGIERIKWIIDIVREVVPTPLYLDTTNMDALEAGLKHMADKYDEKTKPIINSVMAIEERMDRLYPLAREFNAGAVALLWGPEGIPRDSNERGELAAILQYKAAEHGVAESDLWYDPIVTPVSSQQNQVEACTEFMRDLLPAIAPEAMNTCGLSNVSNGAPEKLRPILNQVYFAMLKNMGLKAAIVDPHDIGLMNIARGRTPELEEIVGRVMSGEEIDLGTLDQEARDYVKSTRVLLGQSLYSDSWLEL